MIRTLTIIIIALTAVGCSAATQTPAPQMAYPSQEVVLEQRAPYAGAFADAFHSYETQVQHALSLPYHSQAEAEAVIRSMSSQRFDGILDVELARHGRARADLTSYLARDQAFYSELRARYHGRIEHLAREITKVRERVVGPSEEQMPADPTTGELALNTHPQAR